MTDFNYYGVNRTTQFVAVRERLLGSAQVASIISASLMFFEQHFAWRVESGGIIVRVTFPPLSEHISNQMLTKHMCSV